MAKKWKPRCITENKEYAATSDGYLIPCCWCDKVFNEEWTNNDPLLNALFDEELKIENNNSINDIISSFQWIKFTKSVINGPHTASLRCKYFCYRESSMEKTTYTE